MSATGMPYEIPSPTEDPEAALAAAVTLRSVAERLEAAAVVTCITQGWTWAQVAQALGVSRQAAHKKHARSVRAHRQESSP